MSSCYSKTKLNRLDNTVMWNIFFVLCLLYDPVCDSATRIEKNFSSAGDIPLKVLGRTFAAGSPESKVPAVCQEHCERYFETLANFTRSFNNNTDHTKKHDQCPRIKVNNCNMFAFRRHQCQTITHFAVDNKDASKDGRIRRRVDIKYTFQALENTADVSNRSDPNSAPYSWTYSMSSTLSATEMQRILHETLPPFNTPGVTEVMVTVAPTEGGANATDPSSSRLGAADISMIFLLALVLLLIITSTIYDVIIQKTSAWKHKRVAGVAHSVLTSFSLNTNGRRLLSSSSASEAMNCLHGLRFLSILWILIAHTFYMKFVSPRINQFDDKYVRNIHERVVTSCCATLSSFINKSTQKVDKAVLICGLHSSGMISMVYSTRHLKTRPTLLSQNFGHQAPNAVTSYPRKTKATYEYCIAAKA